MKRDEVSEGVQALERSVVALGNTVESLFADCVVALLDPMDGAVGELRREDYKAHDQWLDVDSLCRELLTESRPNPEQVRFIMAAVTIAADLKRVADESLRIGEGLRACPAPSILQADPTGCVQRMIELTQAMQNDVMEAFINGDAGEANGLHLVFRELVSLNERAARELCVAVERETVGIDVSIRLLAVGQRLERIADEVLDMSNQVARLLREK